MQKIMRMCVVAGLIVASFFCGVLLTEKVAGKKGSLTLIGDTYDDEFVMQPETKNKKRRVSRSSCIQNIVDALEDIAYQILELQERGAQIDKQILCRVHGLLAQDANDIFVSASLDQLKKLQDVCIQYRVDLTQILQHFDALLLVVRDRKI